MKVSQVMQEDVEAVLEDTTIGEVVVTLADAHVHGVPVLNRAGKLVGVISTSDVLEAAAETASTEERERLFDRTSVGDLMTTPPRTISPEADVKEAAQQMLYLDVHRLFVETDGVLAGVVSQSDIVRAVANARL